MLADQFLEAAAGARTGAGLDELARKLWRAHGEGHIAEADAGALSESIEARRAALTGKVVWTARSPPWGFPEPLDAPHACERRSSASADRAPSTATPRSGLCTGRVA